MTIASVLIASAPLRGRDGEFRRILERGGLTPVDAPINGPMTPQDYKRLLPRMGAVLAGGERLDAEVIRQSDTLRVIARTGVGYEAVDLAAATAQRIAVVITPATNHESVAEQVFALLLALSRHIRQGDRAIRSGGWDRTLPVPLRGRTMGIVGLGQIGRAVATRAAAFGMEILACGAPGRRPDPAGLPIRIVDFEELLATADVVSLHPPLTEQTRNLIDRQALSRMKPGAWLINTGRGGLIVEADLAEALASGHLAGAGLDVLTHEPPEPGNPLLAQPNALLSAHVGGIDERALDDMAAMGARAIVDLYHNCPPSVGQVVNAEVLAQWSWSPSPIPVSSVPLESEGR
jgi:phosphoglycerate dehydrogenase-like enzyme